MACLFLSSSLFLQCKLDQFFWKFYHLWNTFVPLLYVSTAWTIIYSIFVLPNGQNLFFILHLNTHLAFELSNAFCEIKSLMCYLRFLFSNAHEKYIPKSQWCAHSP